MKSLFQTTHKQAHAQEATRHACGSLPIVVDLSKNEHLNLYHQCQTTRKQAHARGATRHACGSLAMIVSLHRVSVLSRTTKGLPIVEKVGGMLAGAGVTIIAPNERDVFVTPNGDSTKAYEKGPRKAKYDKGNSDYKDGKEHETGDKQGNWNVYKNGEQIGSYDGDWTPKGDPGIIDKAVHKN
ncbi:MAG: hypothetical protein ABI169_14355 [Chitinophagaceae bacterium]